MIYKEIRAHVREVAFVVVVAPIRAVVCGEHPANQSIVYVSHLLPACTVQLFVYMNMDAVRTV